MTKSILMTAACAAVLATGVFAGETMAAPSKNPVPLTLYGTGWYAGLQLGANLYQDFGGTRRFSFGDNDVAIEPNENIGFVGGLKLGYVFGTGSIRPAIEADVFYNGVRADIDARVNGNNTDFNVDGDLHSVAFLGNFLLRFNCLNQFQPYIGGGLGGFWGESDDVDVTVRGRDFHGSGGDNTGFAWQLIGGADYYFNEHTSLFLEYKFLNYEDAGLTEDRISQHIAVLGLRWHF